MRYSPPLCRSFGKDIGEPHFKDALVLSVSSFSISDAKTGFTQFRAVTIYTNIRRSCQSICACLAEILVLFLRSVSFYVLFATNDRRRRFIALRQSHAPLCSNQIKIRIDNSLLQRVVARVYSERTDTCDTVVARAAILALLYAAADLLQRRGCLCRWLGSGWCRVAGAG